MTRSPRRLGGHSRRTLVDSVPPPLRTSAIEAWVASLERLDDARREALEQLAALEPTLKESVDQLAAGVPFSRLVNREVIRARQRLMDAIAGFNAALADNRAAVIRVLVEDERMTLADVARLHDIPRQVASRLYQRARRGRLRSSVAP